MPLPSDTFHDKLIAYDHGDGADYDHDPRGGTVALYTTCVPLSSDTFHDKLSSCDQGDGADYDHDHEEGLWLSMQPACLCRRTPFMIPGLYVVASHQQQQVNIQDTKPHRYLVYAMCTIYRSL